MGRRDYFDDRLLHRGGEERPSVVLQQRAVRAIDVLLEHFFPPLVSLAAVPGSTEPQRSRTPDDVSHRQDWTLPRAVFEDPTPFFARSAGRIRTDELYLPAK